MSIPGSFVVLIGSGLQIFTAFPSFGPKIPQDNLVNIPEALTLGGWLAGALMWHFTFMWVFIGTGALYLAYQVGSGRLRRVLFTRRDLPDVWPMVRHYFLFKAKPPVTAPYNALQKFAYSATVLLGVASVLTGLSSTTRFSFPGSPGPWEAFRARACGTFSPCAASSPSSPATS